MEHTEQIEVDVPVRTAYNQWTQFEEFPRFMTGVEEVRQLDDTHLHWKAEIAGVEREWDAEITRQVPDEGVAWESTSGAKTRGAVAFSPLGPDRTEIVLQMWFDPEGFTEQAGDSLGFVERRVQGDLERFKEMIEDRRTETGGWRGEVPAKPDRTTEA